MDFQLQRKLPLEAIQEESEDETESTGSSEGEFYPLQVDSQAEEVLDEEEEEDEDEDEPVRISRTRSRSTLSSTSLSDIQSSENEVQNVSVVDLSENAIDGSTTSPWSDSKERTRIQSFRLKAPKISWRRLSEPTPSVKKKNKFQNEPFPLWVADLMINIEEATSHQLVVE